MQYRQLGRTHLRLSALGFGCAAIGQEYKGLPPPSRAEAVKLVRAAWDAGINFFDTAPGYGESEEILGEALEGTSAVIATKITWARCISQASDPTQSLGRLRRSYVDLLQVHNADRSIFDDSWILNHLDAIYRQSKALYFGATVYFPEEASSAIHCPTLSCVQVPYNLQQQGMRRIFDEAAAVGFGVIARSPLAGGAISENADAALQFALQTHGPASVLVGFRSMRELEVALDVERRTNGA